MNTSHRDNSGRPGKGRASGSAGGRRDGQRRPYRADRHDPQQQRSAPREAPPRNPADLRRANQDERGRSPEIDDDVTGKELDREAARQLGTLNDNNRKWVAKHLVMAGRLIDVDPELALEHALAASRRGGRLALVREAVGLAAYAAGDYAEALRELRTYRRISGDQTHLPVMADCERGMDRPQKALELAESPEAQKLTGAVRAELAIVAAGALTDLGDTGGAVKALEIPELTINKAYSFSPRLFTAYGEALQAVGREDEAQRWLRQAHVAEEALGVGAFETPEIIDFDDDPEPAPSVKDVMGKAAGHKGERD